MAPKLYDQGRRRWYYLSVVVTLFFNSECSNSTPKTAADTGNSDASLDGGTSDTTTGDAEPQGCAIVSTEHGPVQGLVSDQSCAFLGIPYAKPPLGALRWKPPQAPDPWTVARLADAYGYACPQANTVLWGTPDEDCLTLNVWAPHPRPSQPVPVMVWINKGENFVFGSSNTGWTEGKNIAGHANTIVVTFNFRLGALGFLAHPALGADSGNYGFLDQIAVLEWVQKNIAAFGGDPDNVTLFGGGSHGGVSVCLHMVSPRSKGLFHRAIMHSGFCPPRPLPPEGYSMLLSRAAAEDQGKDLAQSVDCDTSQDVAACLRSKDVATILDGLIPHDFFNKGEASWGPIVDGDILTDQPYNLVKAGSINKVPLIMGSNKEDGVFYLQTLYYSREEAYIQAMEQMWGDQADQVLGQYPASDYTPPEGSMFNSAVAAAIDLVNDVAFACPARRSARAMAASGVQVYLYQFTLPISYGLEGPWHDPILGTDHATLKTFVFHTPQEEKMPGWEKWIFSEEEEALSWEIMGYWTRFAKTGDPNGADAISSWPVYEESTDRHLELGAPVKEGSGLKKDKCDFWDALLL